MLPIHGKQAHADPDFFAALDAVTQPIQTKGTF
jgi:hypothetical protein